MANLPETATWHDGITQLALTDPVVGGPGGKSNEQATQLGDRTAWLKVSLENLSAALFAHASSVDHPAATTAEQGMVLLASLAEAILGLNDSKAVTPAGLAAALAAATPDLTGMLRSNVNATLSAGFYVTPLALEIAGGTVTPVLLNRNVQTLAVDEAITLANPAEIPPGGMAVIYATQDGSGGHGITWGSAYRVCNGNWSTDPNAVNILWLTTAGGGIVDVAIAQRGEA